MGRFRGVWAESMQWAEVDLTFSNQCPKTALKAVLCATNAVGAHGLNR